MADPFVRLTNARKRFGETVAVDGISLEVARGEIFGLLGPNGAGKTTTISMLAGILRPDEGNVELVGLGDPAVPATRRHLGVAPQSVAIYGDLTGEENVRFFGGIFGLRGARLAERVRHSLQFTGLLDRSREYARNYSGGMQRRLNLACSIVHDPELLFLDEPTVGVDPQSRNLLMENIGALRREGRTILYTTHYMEEAQRLCDRVAIIDHGRVLALDTVAGLLGAHGGPSVVELHVEGENVPDIEGAQRDGMCLRFSTDRPLEVVAELSRAGHRFEKLSVERPQLETVFLNLTGRSLRD